MTSMNLLRAQRSTFPAPIAEGIALEAMQLISRSLTNAVLLPAVLRFNEPAIHA